MVNVTLWVKAFYQKKLVEKASFTDKELKKFQSAYEKTSLIVLILLIMLAFSYTIAVLVLLGIHH
jgi:hypothetical protein